MELGDQSTNHDSFDGGEEPLTSFIRHIPEVVKLIAASLFVAIALHNFFLRKKRPSSNSGGVANNNILGTTVEPSIEEEEEEEETTTFDIFGHHRHSSRINNSILRWWNEALPLCETLPKQAAITNRTNLSSDGLFTHSCYI
mmetsp:Transcript_9180/g.15623  ORF Transcript_9180/g.15623 Transcript_9180/m.15623 type:complete len:142 (+) Transcript_9180:142-567(+)